MIEYYGISLSWTPSWKYVLMNEHFPLEMGCSEQKVASLDYEEVNALSGVSSSKED